MKFRYALTLLVLLFASSASAQAIPNGSFETWDTSGDPTGWVTGNAAPFLITIESTPMSMHGELGARGSVRSVGAQEVPPVLITGSTQNETVGFPFTARPGALKGFLATQLMPNDAVLITVTFTRNTETVGSGIGVFATDMENLTQFEIPIEYISEMTPDTAIVFITMTQTSGAGTPQLGSMFTIDALQFGAATAGVETQNTSNLTVANASTYKLISFNANDAAHSTIEVIDVHGRTIETLFDGVADHAAVRWTASGLTGGMYFIRLTRPEGVQIEKVMVGF